MDPLDQERYDPQAYWQLAGKTYEHDASLVEYEHQERVLTEVLNEIAFESVLEVGCGFGRVGALMNKMFPVQYTGVDISAHQIAAANKRIPEGTFWQGMFQDFPETETYDLVIAVEVLMHIPPEDIGQVIEKMHRLSNRYVLSCDSDEVGATNYHWFNFPHDYRALYRDTLVQERPAAPEGKTPQTIFLGKSRVAVTA